MLSTADVDAGIVAVVPAVVITSVDVSKTPVDLQRMSFLQKWCPGLCFPHKWCQG